MAITGQKVYELALTLIDEVHSAGSIDYSDNAIKTKSLSYLTMLQTELLPSTIAPVVITDLNQDLLLTDRQCLLVLPCGLAAHLILPEDASIASYFNSRYEELRKKNQASIEPIVDVYNVMSGLR